VTSEKRSFHRGEVGRKRDGRGLVISEFGGCDGYTALSLADYSWL